MNDLEDFTTSEPSISLDGILLKANSRHFGPKGLIKYLAAKGIEASEYDEDAIFVYFWDNPVLRKDPTSGWVACGI